MFGYIGYFPSLNAITVRTNVLYPHIWMLTHYVIARQLVFRGTDNLGGWITDANFLQVPSISNRFFFY